MSKILSDEDIRKIWLAHPASSLRNKDGAKRALCQAQAEMSILEGGRDAYGYLHALIQGEISPAGLRQEIERLYEKAKLEGGK